MSQSVPTKVGKNKKGFVINNNNVEKVIDDVIKKLDGKKVVLELTEWQAELFVKFFIKEQEMWENATNLLHPGSLTIHFDSGNNIGRKKEYHVG